MVLEPKLRTPYQQELVEVLINPLHLDGFCIMSYLPWSHKGLES